ncbi:phosphatidic acid phosphatase type 2/haloperoxidase, partial [Pyronema domesticum]
MRLWFTTAWLDLLTMLCLGAVGLGVYYARPAPRRSFPVYFQDGEIVYPQFAYPLRNNIIPIWLAAFLASIIPIVVIALMQIRVRSFWDLNNAIMGLLYSLINAAVFQVFLKWLIGGLRPHFLAVCKPSVDFQSATGTGLKALMYDRSICTGNEKEINDALESFPSGHSTAAFAGFVFLYLYLNAKLKVFSNYAPHMWKQTALYAPILGATLIAGSLTIDEFHHWYDVLAGGIIGTMMAVSSYRMMYASIWDFRFNHVPLPRGNVRGYAYAFGGEDGWGEAVATRRAGWGVGQG